MTPTHILSLAKFAYNEVKARDFRGNLKPLEPWMTPFIINFHSLVQEMEREACAKVCDEEAEFWKDPINGNNKSAIAIEIASLIRARTPA